MIIEGKKVMFKASPSKNCNKRSLKFCCLWFCCFLCRCWEAEEQMKPGPSVWSVWRCLATSSACLLAKISTVKLSSCRWAWQDWLSNCSRYTGGRSVLAVTNATGLIVFAPFMPTNSTHLLVSNFFNHPLRLCRPGSWGSAEPPGRADDGWAGFTVPVRFTL